MKAREQFQLEENHGNVWRYAACFGTIITFIAGIGHVNSFGMIYKDFIASTNSTAKALTISYGVFSIMLAIGGIVLNIMSKSISLRLGGIIGAVTFCVGSFANITISNTSQLPLIFGLLQGIGFGMMVPVSYSTINRHFTKNRTAVMSSIKTIQGFVLMWYPQLIKNVMDTYGFRGTLLVIAGISLHTFPGMLVMKTNETKTRVRKTITDSVENGKDKQENEDLLDEKINDERVSDVKRSKLHHLRKTLLEILNLKVLKDPVYINICVGQSFVNFSDLMFFMLQPMLLFQYGFDTSEVAFCISVGAGADVAGRCLLAVISSFAHINTRVLFYTGTLLTFVFRIVILQIHVFIYVAIITAVLGVLKAWLHVASPLVISNHVSHEDFPGAYAVFMLAAGLVNVACSPFVGLLKDSYQDYIPAFYALTLCCIPCLLSWPIEYVYTTKFQ